MIWRYGLYKSLCKCLSYNEIEKYLILESPASLGGSMYNYMKDLKESADKLGTTLDEKNTIIAIELHNLIYESFTENDLLLMADFLRRRYANG